MGNERTQGVLLTGTVGSGKTSIAIELGHVLAERSIPTAVIDLDWLGWLVGARSDVEALIRANLEASWPNFRARGVTHVVLTRTIHDPQHLDSLRRTITDVDLTIVRVTAPNETLEERLRQRDTGAELDEHLSQARRMTQLLDEAAIEDFRLSNNGSVHEAAAALFRQLGWG